MIPNGMTGTLVGAAGCLNEKTKRKTVEFGVEWDFHAVDPSDGSIFGNNKNESIATIEPGCHCEAALDDIESIGVEE